MKLFSYLRNKLRRKRGPNIVLINLLRRSIPDIIKADLVGMQALPLDPNAKFKIKRRFQSRFGGEDNKRFIKWRMRRIFIDLHDPKKPKGHWEANLGMFEHTETGNLVCVYTFGHGFMRGYFVHFSDTSLKKTDMELGKFVEQYKKSDKQPKDLEEFFLWSYA